MVTNISIKFWLKFQYQLKHGLKLTLSYILYNQSADDFEKSSLGKKCGERNLCKWKYIYIIELKKVWKKKKLNILRFQKVSAGNASKCACS